MAHISVVVTTYFGLRTGVDPYRLGEAVDECFFSLGVKRMQVRFVQHDRELLVFGHISAGADVHQDLTAGGWAFHVDRFAPAGDEIDEYLVDYRTNIKSESTTKPIVGASRRITTDSERSSPPMI